VIPRSALLTPALSELPLPLIVPTAWSLLQAAVDDPDDPLRLPVLATVDDEHRPQARVVVLRAADPHRRVLEIYTDVRSPKVAQLRDRPRATLCFYSAPRRLQLRLSGWVALHHADARAQRAWEATGLYAQRSYLTTAAPGSLLESAGDGLPLDYDPQVSSGEHLAVVRVHVEQLDWLLLAREGHLRAQARALEDGSWTPQWRVP